MGASKPTESSPNSEPLAWGRKWSSGQFSGPRHGAANGPSWLAYGSRARKNHVYPNSCRVCLVRGFHLTFGASWSGALLQTLVEQTRDTACTKLAAGVCSCRCLLRTASSLGRRGGLFKQMGGSWRFASNVNEHHGRENKAANPPLKFQSEGSGRVSYHPLRSGHSSMSSTSSAVSTDTCVAQKGATGMITQVRFPSTRFTLV